MPRKNFLVWDLISKNPLLIKAKIHKWTNGEDLDNGINGVGRSMEEEEEEEEFGAEVIEFENPISFNYVLDLRSLLPSSLPKNVKRYTNFVLWLPMFHNWFE